MIKDDDEYHYIYEMVGDNCLVSDMYMTAQLTGKNPEIQLRRRLKKYANFERKKDPEAFSNINWEADITQLVDDLKQIASKKMGATGLSIQDLMGVTDPSTQDFLFYVLENVYKITRVINLDSRTDDDSD